MMKSEDFYTLKIGQKIYYKGLLKEIASLSLYDKQFNSEECLSFKDQYHLQLWWVLIYSDCSLTPPAIKKRYWQWKVKNNWGWERWDEYLNEEGFTTESNFPYEE